MRTSKGFLLIVFVLLSVIGCKKDLQSLLESDIAFNVDVNDYLQNQLQLQFINANNTQGVTQPKVSLTISGRDAQRVFDINGGSSVKVEGQFAKLVVSPGTPIPVEDPALFTIKAEAPGFLPYQKDLSISEIDTFLNMTLEMVELSNSTKGLKYADASGAALQSDGKISIGQPFTDAFSAQLSMPIGTQVQQSGSVSSINRIELVQFDASVGSVAAHIPNIIPNFSDKVTQNGVPTDLTFLPIGYVQVRVNSKEEAMSFQQSATARFFIPQQSTDPLSVEPIQSGDAMQLYLWDASSSSWSHMADAQVSRTSSGQLVIESTITSSGTIAIATNPVLAPITGRTCGTPLGIQFRRSSNANTLHYVAIVAANDTNVVYEFANNVMVANNVTYPFTRRLPRNVDLRVIVWEYDAYSYRGRRLVVTSPFRSCDFSTSNRYTITVNPPAVTNRPIARFELDTYCPTSKLFYYHEGRIQFRLKGSTGPWADLGLARRSGRTVTETAPNNVPALPPINTRSFSFLETDRLDNGSNYEFQVTISGRPRTGGNLRTETFVKTRSFKLIEFEPFTGTSPGTYQYYKFKRGYWLANADNNTNPCAIWGY